MAVHTTGSTAPGGDALTKHYRPGGEPMPHGNWRYLTTEQGDLHDPDTYRPMTWHAPDNAWLSSGSGRRYTFYNGPGPNRGAFRGVEGAGVHSGSARNVLLFQWDAPASGDTDVTFDGFLGKPDRLADRLLYGVLNHEGDELASGEHDPTAGDGNVRSFHQTFADLPAVAGEPLYFYARTDDTRAL